MSILTINSERSFDKAVDVLRETFEREKYFQVTLNTGKKRSLNQNAVIHVWAAFVSETEQEETPAGVKCLWKYHFGLPILRGTYDLDEKGSAVMTEASRMFNELCIRVIDPLMYEDRIKAMEFIQVTSVMKTKQLKLMMKHIQAHYVGRVKLEFLNDK